MNCHSAPPAAAEATGTKNNPTSMNGGSSGSIGTNRSGPQPYEDEDDGGWNESTSTSTTRTTSATKNNRRTRPPMANVTNRRIEAQAIGLFKSVVGTLLNNCHLCTLYCDEQVRYETQQEATEEPVDKDWIQAQYEIGTGSIGHLFTTATNNINRNTTTHSNAASTTARPTPPPTDYTTTMGNWNTNHNIIQDPHEHHTNGRTLSLATIPTDNTTATAASKKTNHPQQVQSTSSTIVRL